MDLSKYKNKEVEVGLMLPTTYSTTVSGEKTIQESNYDNCVQGKVIEAEKNSLIIEAQHRSKIYRYEIPAHAVGFVLTTDLTESGKQASERMKNLHKDTKVTPAKVTQ